MSLHVANNTNKIILPYDLYEELLEKVSIGFFEKHIGIATGEMKENKKFVTSIYWFPKKDFDVRLKGIRKAKLLGCITNEKSNGNLLYKDISIIYLNIIHNFLINISAFCIHSFLKEKRTDEFIQIVEKDAEILNNKTLNYF